MAVSPEGFRQPFPTRAADSFARRLGRLDAVALLALEQRLPEALRGRNPQLMENALAAVGQEIRAPEPAVLLAVGNTVNRSNRTRFFQAVGRRTRLRLINTDEPGRLVTVPATGRAAVVRPNLNPSILVEQFARSTTGRITTLAQGVVEGTREAIVAEVLQGQGDPEALTRELLASWRANGVPSRIPTRRRTAAGLPVSVNVEAHASFIARDSIGTLQSELTRVRQTAAGIESFVWVTKGDSRVRDSHAARNGRTFTWAEGADGEFPGGPPNCRCHARAVVPDASVLEQTLIVA